MKIKNLKSGLNLTLLMLEFINVFGSRTGQYRNCHFHSNKQTYMIISRHRVFHRGSATGGGDKFLREQWPTVLENNRLLFSIILVILQGGAVIFQKNWGDSPHRGGGVPPCRGNPGNSSQLRLVTSEFDLSK